MSHFYDFTKNVTIWQEHRFYCSTRKNINWNSIRNWWVTSVTQLCHKQEVNQLFSLFWSMDFLQAMLGLGTIFCVVTWHNDVVWLTIHISHPYWFKSWWHTLCRVQRACFMHHKCVMEISSLCHLHYVHFSLPTHSTLSSQLYLVTIIGKKEPRLPFHIMKTSHFVYWPLQILWD